MVKQNLPQSDVGEEHAGQKKLQMAGRPEGTWWVSGAERRHYG